MSRKYPVVCLCGSTRFEKLFHQVAEDLTFAGHIILTVDCWSKKDTLHEPLNEIDEKIKSMLDDIHKEKIRMADWILVLNKDGYIGKSTESEIGFAEYIGKKVVYYFPEFVSQRNSELEK